MRRTPIMTAKVGGSGQSNWDQKRAQEAQERTRVEDDSCFNDCESNSRFRPSASYFAGVVDEKALTRHVHPRLRAVKILLISLVVSVRVAVGVAGHRRALSSSLLSERGGRAVFGRWRKVSSGGGGGGRPVGSGTDETHENVVEPTV